MTTPNDRDKQRITNLLDATKTVTFSGGHHFEAPITTTTHELARRLHLTEYRAQRLIDEMIETGEIIKRGFVMFTDESTYAASAAAERAHAANATGQEVTQ